MVKFQIHVIFVIIYEFKTVFSIQIVSDHLVFILYHMLKSCVSFVPEERKCNKRIYTLSVHLDWLFLKLHMVMMVTDTTRI